MPISNNEARFNALKDMQQFTEDMFNRIIDFQEKKHVAWDESAPFSQRIDKLPLHYFIFSNYDRDPVKQGPTLAHYYPLKKEMYKLAQYLHCAGCREVIDYYPGNGLLGSLLGNAAQMPVIGLGFNNKKPSQIENFYDRQWFHMVSETRNYSPGAATGYFVSWTPSGCNPVPEIVKHKPRLIIFVGSQHINAETGECQVGISNMLDDLPDYQLWDSWEIVRPENLLHKIWPDMTQNIEEVRQVHVFAANEIDLKQTRNEEPSSQNATHSGYFWERELYMAELAAEAMDSLNRGTFGH